ncbi:ataxin-10-like [Artemia franciscana]
MADLEDVSKTINGIIFHDIQDLDSVTDLLRALRSACTRGVNVQKFIGENTILLEKVETIICDGISLQQQSEKVLLMTAVAIQFLGNLTVNNPSNSLTIWNLVKEKILHLCFKLDATKIWNSFSMLLLNVFLQNENLLDEILCSEYVTTILEKLTKSAQDDAEFSQHVIEVCILPRKELSVIYPELPHPSRLFLLETIYHALASTPESKATVSAAFIQYAAEVFKLKSDFMLHVLRRNEDVEPLEYTKMLEILASSSGSDKYVLMLQEDKSLLISTVYLLKCFHQLGKEAEEGFTPVEDLAVLAPNNVNRIQEEPTFCFKRDLIRLIANLTWRNLSNQNEIREMNGIEIIMECCCIDARNPFMQQWCILAMRNLLEDNIENQRYVASMTEQGTTRSEVLSEMGFEVVDKRIRRV